MQAEEKHLKIWVTFYESKSVFIPAFQSQRKFTSIHKYSNFGVFLKMFSISVDATFILRFLGLCSDA